jgi:hypothetical protein
MSKFTGILLGAIIVLALGAITVANAAVTYDAILEWNGPYFRAINSPTIDQMVDDPVADISFVQPFAVAAAEHAAGNFRDVVYVVDSGHNRVQAFEANANYNTETLTYTAAPTQIPVSSFSAPAAPAKARAKIAGTADAITNPYILPHSEVVTVDGDVWTWVADSTSAGFTAANKVYHIPYGQIGAAGAPQPLVVFPTGSLSATSSVTIRYALTNEKTAAAGAFGTGDVDYGVDNAGARVLAEIDEAVALGPSTWQMVRSIATIPNEALSTTDEVFLLDAVDATEQLFYYTVTDAGVVAFVEKYDDVLTTPSDVAVANGGPTEVSAAATETGASPVVTATAVRDASQITGHTYTVVLSGLAGTLTVTDTNTGQVLINAAANGDIGAGATFFAIPGVTLTIDPAAIAPFTSTIVTTKAVTDRYLFVADTGADRIKVIAASDHEATSATNDWLPGDAHSMIAQPIGTDVGLVADQDYFYTVASTVEDYSIYTLTSPIKEGTLETITASPAGTPVTWTRVDDLVTAGPSDNVYTVDWTNGKITFGDGVHGAIPVATTVLSFAYTTTPDVLRYGSSGTGPGHFSAPRGVAARWNSLLGAYDVYVADSGNNRIQKLAFYPASAAVNLPARMDFVCEWNTASSASDLLNNPVDVAVALDNQTLGTGKTCYVAVSDQGNNRIVTYVDEAATTGGGSIVPTWDATAGARGNSLGLYTQVEGLCFLNNANDLDIYACDGQRGVVTKYEESVATTITGIMGTSLPGCFPQSANYTFTITTTNPPIGGTIEFWYSTEDTFDEATAHLCFPADSILSTAATAVWTFADTPGGAPADRSIDDGGYYLYARMKDSNGILLATAETTVTDLLCMDSTLLPGYRGVDRIDGDRTLYLQNGLERVVNLTLAYPESIIVVGIGGTFPFANLEVTAIDPGNGWDATGYINTIFNQGYSNTAGTFLVNTSVTGSPAGLTTAGPHVMAEMTVKSKPTVLSSSQKFLDGTITLVQANSGMVDINGDQPAATLWTTRNVNLRWGYLGDLATNGLGADSTLPNLAPDPDGKINFEDQMIFTLGWNGVGNVQDRISDIGPTEGAVPDLRPIPDGLWNVDDLLAFTLMYSWAADLGYYKDAGGLSRTAEPRPVALGGPVSGSAAVRSVSVLGAPKTGEFMTVDLNVDGVRDLAGALLNVGFDPARLELVSVENGGFLDGKSGSLFFKKSGQGWLEVSATRLDQDQPGVDGRGTVARATFRILDENAGDLNVQYDLRSAAGTVLGRGTSQAGAYTGGAVGFQLYAAHPNPVRGSTNIIYAVPTATDLSLDVYDVTGRHVRSLFSGRRDAGYHVAQFDGRDDAGSALSGGIYFYRLQANGKTATQKLTLSR